VKNYPDTDWQALTRITYVDKLIVVLAITLITSLFVTIWHAQQGTHASIQSPQQLLQLDLQHAQTIEVAGVQGTSILQVNNGKLRFVSSPCKRKICIHSGWQHLDGDVTACLPNRVSVAIRHRDSPYDSINF